MACDASVCTAGVCVAPSMQCAGNSSCIQAGPGTDCGNQCSNSPQAMIIVVCGQNAMYVDCTSGCMAVAPATSCGNTCVNASAVNAMCPTCSTAGCMNLCSNCDDTCDYGCQDATHQPAYAELGAIADKISSVDGVALINLITEEMNRRGGTTTAMTSAAVGTKVMNSTMTAARTNLSRMGQTVSATSAGTKATKTLFQAYANAARTLYNSMVYH